MPVVQVVLVEHFAQALGQGGHVATGEAAVETYGQLDIACNSAAVSRGSLVLEAFEPGEVHLWGIDLLAAPADIEHLGSFLAEDERRRAARFHFDRHRRRFIVSQGALRALLGRYLDKRARGRARSAAERLLALGASAVVGYVLAEPGWFTFPRNIGLLYAGAALVTAATEPKHMFTAFTAAFSGLGPSGLSTLSISPRERLDDVVRRIDRLNFGGTDCALPMLEATKRGWSVDVFVVYTDNETWAGRIHPSQALRQYREKTGIPARLVVVGMASNGFTIADPADGGMLDVVGFDTATPRLIAEFVR